MLCHHISIPNLNIDKISTNCFSSTPVVNADEASLFRLIIEYPSYSWNKYYILQTYCVWFKNNNMKIYCFQGLSKKFTTRETAILFRILSAWDIMWSSFLRILSWYKIYLLTLSGQNFWMCLVPESLELILKLIGH